MNSKRGGKSLTVFLPLGDGWIKADAKVLCEGINTNFFFQGNKNVTNERN